jgi:hypothetical protein
MARGSSLQAIDVIANHIGDAAAIGPSGVLQIMIRLGDRTR